MAFINLLQAVYPVGAVYISTINTSPSSLIGGTWAQITDAALRASGSIGYVGSDTHIQTVSEMPSHTHSLNEVLYVQDSILTNATTASNPYWYVQQLRATGSTGGGKQCRLSNVLTTALFGTELRRFFGGDVNGIY